MAKLAFACANRTTKQQGNKMSPSKNKKKLKKTKKSERAALIPVHPKCAKCLPAKCCRYISLEIDKPINKRDYDDMLWFLAHENISIYLEGKKWYLMVHNHCTFLDPKKNACKIYDKRPKMCREHSVEDCEFDSDYEFDEHFKSYDELKRWLKKNKKMK